MSEYTAKLVKSRLKSMGKRQAWLAEKTGVSINAVSKWTKDGKIATKNLQAVADALEISADQLLSGSVGLSVALEESTLERVNAEERALLEQYRSRSAGGRKFVRDAANIAEPDPRLSLHVRRSN